MCVCVYVRRRENVANDNGEWGATAAAAAALVGMRDLENWF